MKKKQQKPITVQVLNISKFLSTPKYQTQGSAGCDLYADLVTPVFIPSGESKLISTGLKTIPPEGYCLRILPRSGLAVKNITCHPGLIDSDYRDEIKVLIINNSGRVFQVNGGDRIAQLVIQKVEQIEWDILSKQGFEEITEKEENNRKGGFGSTGI